MKFKVGIIGNGHIAQRHKLVLAENENFDLISIADEKKENHPQNLDIFNNPNIDLVIICTPSGNHASLAIEALKFGKHVLVEKPMALNSEDCSFMIEAAKLHQKRLFVVKQNRFNSPIKDLKKALDENLFGQVFQIEVKAFWNRNEAYYQNSNWRGTKQLDGGIMFNQFSHFIDILYFLFGDIVPEKTILNNFKHPYIEFEDSLATIFKTKKGILGSINVSTNATNLNMEGSLTVLSEFATLKIGGKYLNTIDYLEVLPEKQKEIAEQKLFQNNAAQENNHAAVYESVYQALLGNHSKNLASAEEGKKVVEIIEKIYQAAL
jgi:predicted dehydrogenase